MTYEIHNMDCRVAMSLLLAPDSVDSIVCDPPYGLSKEPDVAEVLRHWLNGDDYIHSSNGFMAASWDSFVPGPSVWREAYRVLKPGGYLLAFFGTRTYDLGVMAIRLAGFEIRDEIAWLYGSGFPKSLNVGKAIDRRGGNAHLCVEVGAALQAARKTRGITKRDADERYCGGATLWSWYEGRPAGQQLPTASVMADIAKDWTELARYAALLAEAERDILSESNGSRLAVRPGQQNDRSAATLRVTAPSTDAAKQWDGWGTALKPAHEPIVVARKPFSGTVAQNVQTYGTGALNIDACRVGEGVLRSTGNGKRDRTDGYGMNGGVIGGSELGRFPANVIHDGHVPFPATTSIGHTPSARGTGGLSTSGHAGQNGVTERTHDSGSAARFFKCCQLDDEDIESSRIFYAAKASKRDRSEGCEAIPPAAAGQLSETNGQHMTRRDEGYVVEPRGNNHPTVKPTELMRYLVRLVTPPGGTVLDPFTGSGSTGKAAILEGFDFIGCELDADYVRIAEARCAYAAASFSS